MLQLHTPALRCTLSAFNRPKDVEGYPAAPEEVSPTALLGPSLLFLRFPKCVFVCVYVCVSVCVCTCVWPILVHWHAVPYSGLRCPALFFRFFFCFLFFCFSSF